MIRVCVLAFLILIVFAGPAEAHVVQAGTDLRVAQTLAGQEVTVVVAGAARVPARLRVSAESVSAESVSAESVRPTALPLRLELRSGTDGGRSAGTVRVNRGSAALLAERAGPYELRVQAGDEVAVIPFRVLVARDSSWVLLIYGGFLVAGLLLVGGLLTGRLTRAVAGGAGAAAGIAAVVVLLEPYLVPPVPEGAAPEAAAPAVRAGRPYAQGMIAAAPARPVAGKEFVLTLRLVDGATGQPVDDLAVHHEALAHLVVTSTDGDVFRHVHPLRTAPGVLSVRLSLPEPGRYLAYAEIERQDSGGQLISGTFSVSGAAVPDEEAPDAPATPTLTPAIPAAGSPVTIGLTTEGPVRNWLGMPGHLIVRSEDGSYLSHVHAMASGRSALRFTLSLPRPGRYLAWAQYAAGGRIVTRPFTLEANR